MNGLTVPIVLPLAQTIYDESPTGCCLHIVLDDGNVDDGSVDFCISQAGEKNHPRCLELAGMLRKMSKTQRLKIGGSVDRMKGIQ